MDHLSWTFEPLPVDPGLDVAIVDQDKVGELSPAADFVVSIWRIDREGMIWEAPGWLVERSPSQTMILRFNDVGREEAGVISDGILWRVVHVAPHLSGKVVVHCHHGINRSTAVALVIFAVRLGPGREREAAAGVREIERRTFARGWRTEETMPNAKVVWEAFLAEWGDFAGIVS